MTILLDNTLTRKLRYRILRDSSTLEKKRLMKSSYAKSLVFFL
jgi:hypothetical protein